jgi:cell division protein FtsI/penicillin-binding protein 2
VSVKTVCADPTLVGTNQQLVAQTLAPWLGMSEDVLLQKLALRTRLNEKGETVTNQFVILKRKVPLETWDAIQKAMAALTPFDGSKKLSPNDKRYQAILRTKAVFSTSDQIRQYPNQALAAHVLGFATSEETIVNKKPVAEMTGRDGIELTLNQKLAGARGWRLTEASSKGELVSRREQDVRPRDGFNAVLTIDSVVQSIVEEALAEAMHKYTPISASSLVVRPSTGEILAMATLPDFDPNDPGKSPTDHRRNRVITDIAEPGSTFKVVVVSGALNDKLVTLTDHFYCEKGLWFYCGKPLRDHDGGFGDLTTEGIITRSSNIGAAKIGLRLGEDRLYEYVKNFGFGARTGIPLQGEVNGIVHPVKNWSKISIAQIPMGQGVAVTPLQMMMAVCAIANQGVLMRPMLVDRLEDKDHTLQAKFAPIRLRQVISAETAAQMTQAMKTVVSEEGTAEKAALDHYQVAGKTGTAQKAENGTYAKGKYFSSFIGFFPADRPEVCISVVLDEPKNGHYGGKTAGPVFKQIAEKVANYLNIKPDDAQPAVPADNLAAPDPGRSLKTAAASRD